MFKNGQKIIYAKTFTSLEAGPIPLAAKGVIIKCIEDEMLVDFFEYGKAIVVPSCLQLDE
ncbi:MAG: hypothetical protein WCF95_00735 [bacterium]